MKNCIPNRFSTLEFKNGKALKNRVVVPAMASQTADVKGYATEKTLAHYARLAQSRAGLVMVEYTYVANSGRSELNQLGISSRSHLFGLSQVAKVIQSSGALAGIQLTHAGGKSSRDLTGGVLLSPSGVTVPVKDRQLEIPDALSMVEIAEFKNSFFEAAEIADQAGFDCMELHAAHGYGFNQWLSPLTNRRSDFYGGSLENRTRILLETLEGIRTRFPKILLAVRLPGQDFIEGGLTLRDSVWIAQKLEERGVDFVDVSSGLGGWRRPMDRNGEGYLVAEAAEIQSALRVPVMGVGGIQGAGYIDQVLQTGQITLAAVGRAILQDPEQWAKTHLNEEN